MRENCVRIIYGFYYKADSGFVRDRARGGNNETEKEIESLTIWLR